MILSFSGFYRFLSNFYLTPVEFEGIPYPSAEHAYQAAKICDDEIRRAFAKLKRPGTAKRIGKSIPLREGWDDIKVDVMRAILRDKFSRDSVNAYRLCSTYPEILVEGNTWHDNFWGQCFCDRCNHELNIVGHNWLGQLLMERRKELLQW